MLLKTKELFVLMIMVGTPVVLVSRNITRLVMATTNKARVAPATANIKNVVKNVPDTTTLPAIFLPDTSKTEAVRAVPVLNIRLNAILIHQIPELMLIAVRQPAVARVVKMTPELIIPNALARPCMNGARRRKNVSARRGTNTLAPVPDIPAVMVIVVITNIKNVNARQAILGTRRPELAFAAVLINTPARAATSPVGRVRLAAANIPPANVRPVSLGTHQAECAFATVPTGVRLIKIALV